MHFGLKKGNLDQLMSDGLMGGDAEIAEYERGGTPWCLTYTFMPDELKALLRKIWRENIELAGPGAYARTIPRELLVKIMNDPSQRLDFLEFCYQYDSNPYVCGMGKDNLLAKVIYKIGCFFFFCLCMTGAGKQRFLFMNEIKIGGF